MDEERDETNREKLGDRLETLARKSNISGIRRESFVDTQSLCGRCRWAQITRRASRNNRVIECANFQRVVPEDIIECSAFSAQNEMSLGMMAEIAILIDNAEPKRVGFHPRRFR